MKVIAAAAFVVLVLHSMLVKTGTLETANIRMGLALAFLCAMLFVLRKEFEEFFG